MLTFDEDKYLSDANISKMFRNFDYQNQGFISKKNIDEAFKRKEQRIDDNDVEQIFEGPLVE